MASLTLMTSELYYFFCCSEKCPTEAIEVKMEFFWLRRHREVSCDIQSLHPSTLEAKAGGPLTLSPVWFTQWIQGQPGLHRTIFQNPKQCPEGVWWRTGSEGGSRWPHCSNGQAAVSCPCSAHWSSLGPLATGHTANIQKWASSLVRNLTDEPWRCVS